MLLPMSAAASTVGMASSLQESDCANLQRMGSDRLQQAVLWACQQHFGQWRDGDPPIPYVCHPLEVLGILRYTGGVEDEDMLCTAVLHDVVEETDATVPEIRRLFGNSVAKLVEELTRREPTAKETAGMSKDQVWELRAGMLLHEIAEMGTKAKTVKLCDRISNLRESRFTRKGKKLDRYVFQTWRILDTIPRTVHPGLWDVLEAEAETFGEVMRS